jgi:hypothetical protein
MTANPQINQPENNLPAPLEFLEKELIHESNQEIVKREQLRWRLLTRMERWQMQNYVHSLARQLKRGKYNQKILMLAKLRQMFRAAVETHRTATYINNEARQQALERIRAMQREGKYLIAALDEMRETYERYSHHSGWLEYEKAHREELKLEAKKDKKAREEMRREAKWIEQLLIDVFRKTPGCHHLYTDRDSGKERCETPKFMRSVIKPDSHWFYLKAQTRVLLGYKVALPYGVNTTRLRDEVVLENMRAATKRQVDVMWSDTGQMIYRVARLDSPDALPREVKWRDAMKFYKEKNAAKFPFILGADDSRNFIWQNLVDEPHILLAGKSQSGKSNNVNGMIATWASTHTPDEWRVVLIDQKGGLEFTHWHELPHVLWEVVKTIDGVEPTLKRIVSLMKKRMSLLEKVKAKNIDDYNRRVDKEHQLERVSILIDEMNTFVGMGALTEEIHNLIMLISSQGRAVGLHLVIATQHPEVKVLPGRIKTNIGVRASGAMPTISASQIILDSPEAARIPNIPGRFVYVIGMKTLILQVPRILDEDIAGVVSTCRQKYTDVRENLRDMEANAPKLVVWDEQRVLVSCIEWLDGHLGGQKLHNMLGDESPGERHLTRACKRLIDDLESVGYVEREDTNTRYVRMKRRGKGVYVQPFDKIDETTDTEDGDSMSGEETLSERVGA